MGVGILIKTKESFLLESKTTIPTKEQQILIPSSGYYGLGNVVVEPIPENYNNTEDATVVANHLLEGDIAYGSTGKINGEMINNGDISYAIDVLTETEYVIPEGYTSGGTITLADTLETALAAI